MPATNDQHYEWFNLIEIAGPFLAIPVLQQVFPQGLDGLVTNDRQRLRQAYEEWVEVVENKESDLLGIHREWILMVMKDALEYGEELKVDTSELHEPLEMRAIGRENKPAIIVTAYAPGTNLLKPVPGSLSVESPEEIMRARCKTEEVRIGIVTNGEEWMLVNAPVGKTSGYAMWHARIWWQEPVTLKAFSSLLNIRRAFGPPEETMDQLLERSTEFHEEVTDTLGEQVRHAVEVLVRALGRADQDRNGELLKDVDPKQLYEAGLTVMMRLVFTLCAEERELLLLGDPLYDQNYALSNLRAQLREDSDQHGPEVLEKRFDAWSRLLSTFRMIYGGAEHEGLRLPALGGSLFYPDRFPFLEGRAPGTNWKDEPANPLPIDNHTVLLLLRSLQVLQQKGGAQMLSYKGLDVEQIGHVYEGLLEYTVDRVDELSIGFSGSKTVTNPIIPISELLDLDEAKLAKKLADETGKTVSAIKNALKKEPEESALPALIQALGNDEESARKLLPLAGLIRKDSWGTLMVYPANSFAIVPGEGRRATGAHYTPAEFARDIVEKTLTPVIYEGPAEGWPEEQWKLRSSAELLDLKVCDPAMGSAAFLVATCRYLSEKLINAWKTEEDSGKEINVDGLALEPGSGAELMPKELDDRLLVARRLIAERCIYGVDMNPMAVELAKLSIWLVTLQKGRPFGFLDHNLRSGDALLGLHDLRQLTTLSMHPKEDEQALYAADEIREVVRSAVELRKQLREITIRDVHDVEKMAELNTEAKSKLVPVELLSDAMIGEALICGGKEKKLKESLDQLSTRADGILRLNEDAAEEIKTQTMINLSIDQLPGKAPRKPFHWALEFPEVFENGGFNGFVGNPPYQGGKRVSEILGSRYNDLLVYTNPDSKKNADLAAHFFRKAFKLTSSNGCDGFVTTNTISQGDTRQSGLTWICINSGTIYRAQKRINWPGKAAVIVSLVFVYKGRYRGEKTIGIRKVKNITAFLFHTGGSESPESLEANNSKSFQGVIPLSKGFVFNDKDKKNESTPVSEMERLVQSDPKNKERIFPFIGYAEVANHPKHNHSRYIINFEEMNENVARQWPDLMKIIEEKVKPERIKKDGDKYPRMVYEWWKYWNPRPALYSALRNLNRVLVAGAQASAHFTFAFLDSKMIFSSNLTIIAAETYSSFATIQSSVHEVWSRFFMTTLKDDLVYTPTTCFENFPFLENWQNEPTLEVVGKTYYEFRADLMVRNDEGLTKTYNRFHDPEETHPDILKLRELHAAMDRAVLDAYGWTDISTDCEFIADYEVEEGKKVPWRYRWPEEVHDEVLARLLELNQKRYEEEVAQGLHDKKKPKAKAEKSSQGQTELF